jgi:hypothetical protein
MTFLDHPLFQELLSLKLDRDNFAIAGSGPIFARGWINDPSDIDVVARGSAWAAAVQLGQVTPALYSNVHQVSLYDGDLEILDGWFPERWPVNQIIDEADLICGLRFVRLDIIVTTKKMLARPKDLIHLRVIEKYADQDQFGQGHGCLALSKLPSGSRPAAGWRNPTVGRRR